MDAARRGYAILKLNGRAHGLEGLRRELGKRFEQRARSKPAWRLTPAAPP